MQIERKTAVRNNAFSHGVGMSVGEQAHARARDTDYFVN